MKFIEIKENFFLSESENLSIKNTKIKRERECLTIDIYFEVSTRVGLDRVSGHALVLQMTMSIYVSQVKVRTYRYLFATLVPVDAGRWTSFGLAVQRDILLLDGVYHDLMRAIVAYKSWWCYFHFLV